MRLAILQRALALLGDVVCERRETGNMFGPVQVCVVSLQDVRRLTSLKGRDLPEETTSALGVASEVKVVAIGAVATARQVVEYDPEMRNRVAEIRVPLMTEKEIRQIAQKGEELLNFRLSPAVRDGIVRYSNGLASVCHHLCLNICNAAGIEHTMERGVDISQKELHAALNQYLDEASDTLKSLFDKALRSKKNSKFDNFQLVLRALSHAADDGLTAPEILAEIKKTEPRYPQSNLSYCINQLVNERGQILRYDGASGRYFFSDPLYRAYLLAYFRRKNAEHDSTEDIASMTRRWREELVDSLLKQLTSDLFLPSGITVRRIRPNDAGQGNTSAQPQSKKLVTDVGAHTETAEGDSADTHKRDT